MEQRWKEYSIYKKGILIVIAFLVLYNLAANTHVIVRMARSFLVIIMPFLIGIVIAYFLARPISNLARVYDRAKFKFVKRNANTLAVISTFMILFAAVTVVVIYITPIIRDNVIDLVNNMDVYYANAMIWVNSIEPGDFLYNFLPESDYELTSSEILNIIPFGDGDHDLLGFLTNNLTNVFTGIVGFTTSILNFGMGLIIALYLLLYKPSVLALTNRIAAVAVKPNVLQFIKDYVHKANTTFYKFISAQFLDACILGTLATILLAVIGVEYAVTFGILLGVFNMIPFFGSIIATLITVFITFFTGGFDQALITLVLLFSLQQLDAQFINPKITGDSLGLNPLVVVTAILIGASFGIFGMFVAVPIAGVLKIFLDDFLAYREKQLAIKPLNEES